MFKSRGKYSGFDGGGSDSDSSSSSSIPKKTIDGGKENENNIELMDAHEEKEENKGVDSIDIEGDIIGEITRNSPSRILPSSKNKDVILNFSESLGLNDPKIASVFARFIPSIFLNRKKFFVPRSFEIDMSQYDPAAYVEGHFKDQVRYYDLNWWPQRFFVTVEIHDSSYVSVAYFVLLQGAIILSAISMISSSMDEYQEQPATCLNPACDNDATLCPNTIVCEPVAKYYLHLIDFVCAVFFGVDYIFRLSTCWTVSPILSGIVPDGWYHREFHTANIEGREVNEEPKYSPRGCFLRYMFSLPNIIDVVSFLPYFIEAAETGSMVSSRSQTMFVRLVRLLRLLRLFKLSANSSSINHILYQALSKSFHAGSFILFCVVVGIVLFGSIIYILEGGDFTVTAEYPNGKYYRNTLDGTDKEITPYQSIPVSMYWAVVTLTTLGYGDLYPTSPYGRVVASICAIFGVLVLAFPVSLLGTYFNEAHHEHSNAAGILHKIDLAASKFLVNLKGTKPIKNIVRRGLWKIRKNVQRMAVPSIESSDTRQDFFRRRWVEIIDKLKKLNVIKTTDALLRESVGHGKRMSHIARVSGQQRVRTHRENEGVRVTRNRNISDSNSTQIEPTLPMRGGHPESDKVLLDKMERIMQMLSTHDSEATGTAKSAREESSRRDTEVLSQKIDQSLCNFSVLMELIEGVNRQQDVIVSLMKKYDATNGEVTKKMQVLSSRMNKLNDKLNLVEKQTTQHHIIIHTDNTTAGGAGANISHSSVSQPVSPEGNPLTAETVTSTGRLRMIDRVINSGVITAASAQEFNHDMYDPSIAESRTENNLEAISAAVDESEISDETVNGSLDEYEYELYDE